MVMNKVSFQQTLASFGVIAAFTPALCFGAGEQIVKIGMTSPLSGAQAAIGKDNANGAQMAIDQLNQQGLVIGGSKIKFELLNEDDQADPKIGVQVAQKLVDAGVKAVIGPYNSGVAVPASRVYNDAQIVLAVIASNPKITMQGYPYVFRVTPTDNALGGTMGVYAAKEIALKRVAVIDDRSAYGVGVADEFIKKAKANGIEIVGRDYTNDKATDFNAIITSIKSKKPDGIFYGGMYSQGSGMKRQMKQLGLNVYLMGGDGICNAEMGKLGGDAVDEKVLCTVGGIILDQNPLGKDFSARYEKRFNLKPLMYSISFYDGVMVVAEAMKKANSVDPKKFAPAMAAVSYKGIAGSYEFDQNRDLKNSPVTVYHFTNSVPVPVKTY
jgi:branched-chain amino acid transport system substrate-binding protein